jgi:hypothetical protein
LSEAASTISLLTHGNQAADHLISRLVGSDLLLRLPALSGLLATWKTFYLSL